MPSPKLNHRKNIVKKKKKRERHDTATQTTIAEIEDEMDLNSQQTELVKQLKTRLKALELSLERVSQDEELLKSSAAAPVPDWVELHGELKSKLVQLQLLQVRKDKDRGFCL